MRKIPYQPCVNDRWRQHRRNPEHSAWTKAPPSFELADVAQTASNCSEQRSLSSMENERAKLLAQAERCWRLVASITDPDTVERLTGLAEECERRAAEITSQGEEGDR